MPPERRHKKTTQLRQPTLGWLDLSAENTEAARKFIQSWTTEGSIDELGLGILRDAFSDRFFPATNTIMTEARYLVFIPAVYRRLERGRPPLDPHSASRTLQDGLRQVLSDSYGGETGHGVIGVTAGRDLARFPSDVYWGALRLLGIYRHANDTETETIERLRQRPETWAADEGASVPGGSDQVCWDGRFPYFHNDDKLFDAAGKWRVGLRFELTAHEAEYLLGCYLGEAATNPTDRQTLAGSLLAHLLRERIAMEFELPWKAPVPESLATDIAHARWLSALAAGATLHYTYLLAVCAGKSDVADSVRAPFVRWWQAGREIVQRGTAKDFLGNDLVRKHLRPGRKDAEFLDSWAQGLDWHRDSAAFLADASAAVLIERRESMCKTHKSRFKYERYRSAWQGGIPRVVDDAYLFPYRSNKGCLFARRILAALGEPAT